MATKDEMEREILQIFDTFEKSFREIKVNRLAFCKWLNRFQMYNDLRRVNRYMQKLMPPAIAIRSTLRLYKPYSAWASLKLFSRNSTLVRLLADQAKDLRTVWVARPKMRKKGSS